MIDRVFEPILECDMSLERTLSPFFTEQKLKPFNIKGEIIFVIGGPGAGKRTHCSKLAEDKGYIHISASQLIRNILIGTPPTADETPEVKAIREAVKNKELLDDQMIIDLVKSEMLNYPRAAGFLLDGCPRNTSQLAMFESQIKPCNKILFFDTPENLMIHRVLDRGNPDDTIESVKKSIDVYVRRTMPVVKALEKRRQFYRIDTVASIDQVYQQVAGYIKAAPVEVVSYFEFLKLYFKMGNFYDTIDELQTRHGGASEFQVMLGWVTMFYVIQNREDVRRMLTANTVTGYQNHNFEVAAGHSLNINGVQAWQNKSGDEKNPLWLNIHKGLASSVGSQDFVISLVKTHLPKFLMKTRFNLDETFERFMLDFWVEYMFGDKVNPDEFRDMRKKMLGALSYAYYGNRFKSLPYLGNLTCRIYGYWKGDEFKEVDKALMKFINQAGDQGLIARFRKTLELAPDFPADKIDQAVLDNAFDFVLVFDFIHNALYETLAEIVRRNIDATPQRKRAFAQGLSNAFLFPYRVRVPNETISLQSATVPANTPVYINLVKSGLYNSFGPRACIGTAVSDWIKDTVWSYLEEVQFRLIKITYPEERERVSHNRDVPISPERYEVEWQYPRNYLQKVLPDYRFKGVEHFYDVLKTFENPVLTAYVVSNVIESIKASGVNLRNLSIVVPEVRGIPLAAMIAKELFATLVIARIPQKIPGDVFSLTYTNAYHDGTLELSRTSDVKGRDVVLIDDGIASGGTALASAQLIEQAGGTIKLVAAIINHKYKVTNPALKKYPIHTVFDFEDKSLKLAEKPMLPPVIDESRLKP